MASFKFPVTISISYSTHREFEGMFDALKIGRPSRKLTIAQLKQYQLDDLYLTDLKVLIKTAFHQTDTTQKICAQIQKILIGCNILESGPLNLPYILQSLPLLRDIVSGANKLQYYKNTLRFIQKAERKEWTKFDSSMRGEKILEAGDIVLLREIAEMKLKVNESQQAGFQKLYQSQMGQLKVMYELLDNIKSQGTNKEDNLRIERLPNGGFKQSIKTFYDFFCQNCVDLSKKNTPFLKILTLIPNDGGASIAEINQINPSLPQAQKLILNPIFKYMNQLKQTITNLNQYKSNSVKPGSEKEALTLQKEMNSLRGQLQMVKAENSEIMKKNRSYVSEIEQLKTSLQTLRGMMEQKLSPSKQKQTHNVNIARLRNKQIELPPANIEKLQRELNDYKQKHRILVQSNTELTQQLKKIENEKYFSISRQPSAAKQLENKVQCYKATLSLILQNVRKSEWDLHMVKIKNLTCLSGEDRTVLQEIGRHHFFFSQLFDKDIQSLSQIIQQNQRVKQQNERLKGDNKNAKYARTTPNRNPVRERMEETPKDTAPRKVERNNVDPALFSKLQEENRLLQEKYKRSETELQELKKYIAQESKNSFKPQKQKNIRKSGIKQYVEEEVNQFQLENSGLRNQLLELKSIHSRQLTKVKQQAQNSARESTRLRAQLQRFKGQIAELESLRPEYIKYKNQYENSVAQLERERNEHAILKDQYNLIKNQSGEKENSIVNKLSINEKLLRKNTNDLQKICEKLKQEVAQLQSALQLSKTAKDKKQEELTGLKRQYNELLANYEALLSKENQMGNVKDEEITQASAFANAPCIDEELDKLRNEVNLKEQNIKSLTQRSERNLKGKQQKIAALQLKVIELKNQVARYGQQIGLNQQIRSLVLNNAELQASLSKESRKLLLLPPRKQII